MSRLKTRIKTKRRSKKYSSKFKRYKTLNNTYAKDGLRKKVSFALPVIFNANGTRVQLYYGGNYVDSFLVWNAIKGTPFWLTTVLSGTNPQFERIRCTGVKITYIPTLQTGGGNVSPLVFGFFPELNDTTVLLPTKVLDAKTKMIAMPFNTSRQQSKYWPLMTTANTVGAGNSPVLGTFQDVSTVRDSNALPGMIYCSSVTTSAGTGALRIGMIIITCYLHLQTPLA